MLNLDALRPTDMRETPYRWAQLANPVQQSIWRELAENFPPESWFTKIGVEDMLIGPVINQRVGLVGPLPVAAVWEQLIRAFCSPAYRAAMARLTGLSLQNDTLQFNFNRYNPGNWSRPHLDSSHASVVHLLYFNDLWRSDWGGLLAILDNQDPAALYQNVLPMINSSILLVPSNRSWHMVTPIARIAPSARLSLKISFVKPSAYETDIYKFYRQNGIAIHQI